VLRSEAKRDREFADPENHLLEALNGRWRVILVGEAGVDKSSLVEEFTRESFVPS